MDGRDRRADRCSIAAALALALAAWPPGCRRAEAGSDGVSSAAAPGAGDIAARPSPPPSCAGTLPRLDMLPPGYGWHCYEDADEPRFSFCTRAAGNCEAARASTVATLAARGETHRVGACASQPGAWCHTFVRLEGARPLYFCFPGRDGCEESRRGLSAQPESYGEVSCCEAVATL